MTPFRFGACSQARVCSRGDLHHKRQVPLVTAGLSIGAAGGLQAAGWQVSEVFNSRNMSENSRVSRAVGR